MATILNLILLLIVIMYRAFWKEAGRRWDKESKQLQDENKQQKQTLEYIQKKSVTLFEAKDRAKQALESKIK